MNEVEVIEVDNGSGEDWSTEYYAIISDLDGNIYEGTYLYWFKKDYDIGKAIYVEIPAGNNKKTLVIPRRDVSRETWNYGLREYNKYTNYNGG